MKRVCQGCTGAKSSQWPKVEQFEQQINKVVLDYNAKYKVNIHESILIQINDRINRWRTDNLLYRIPNNFYRYFVLEVKHEHSDFPQDYTIEGGTKRIAIEKLDNYYLNR